MGRIVKELVLDVLRKVLDPEIGGNVVDIGLISSVDIKEEQKIIEVSWTPTVPFCPMVLAISAAMLYVLRRDLEIGDWKIRVLIDKSVITADYWNSQLSNEEAMEEIMDRMEKSGQIKYFITE